MKKVLLSGVPFGPSGVGRLITALAPDYLVNGFSMLVPRSPRSLQHFLDNGLFLEALSEIFLRLAGSLFFRFKCLALFKSKVIFLHPQTAGFWLLFYLSLFNDVSLYVMDNSFFCIRSYNIHPLNNKECLDCLGRVRPYKSCSPYPCQLPKPLNIFYLRVFKRIYTRLQFLTLNELQSELLFKHFGPDISVTVLGMPPKCSTLFLPEVNSKDVHKSYESYSFDIVFHGATHPAKGLLYVLELAGCMSNFTFLVPDSLVNVTRVAKSAPPSNVICKPLMWETGLREAVMNSKITLNPSMWSAPIEGALLKSLSHAKLVATVETQYGYEKQIIDNPKVLRLPSDPYVASSMLANVLSQSLENPGHTAGDGAVIPFQD